MHLLPNRAAAVSAQGSGLLSGPLGRMVERRADVENVDQLNAVLAAELPVMWQQACAAAAKRGERAGVDLTPTDSVAFTAGYSPAAGRCVATGFASDSGFVRWEVTDPFVHPSPLNLAPSPLELGRLARTWADLPDMLAALDQWAARPTLTALRTDEQWAVLAELCREERAMAEVQDGFKVLLGGDVHLTTLHRDGSTEQRCVHTFDDSTEQLTRLLAGTLHPFGQAGRCPCGSDSRFVDCCLAGLAERPCPCGTGRTFEDCCSISGRAGRSAAAHSGRVREGVA